MLKHSLFSHACTTVYVVPSIVYTLYLFILLYLLSIMVFPEKRYDHFDINVLFLNGLIASSKQVAFGV